MPASNASLTLAANAIKNAIAEVSLHSDNPGGEGTANELTGGGYTRDTSASWNNAVNGVASLNGTIQFNGPGTSSTNNAQYIGFWTTGGAQFLGSAQLSTPKTIGPGDTLTITAAPISVTAA